MHGQQINKYTEMHGQQNDKYTKMHGQQNVKKRDLDVVSIYSPTATSLYYYCYFILLFKKCNRLLK